MHRIRTRLGAALVGLACFCATEGWRPGRVRAQTSYPMITHIEPVAIRRGATAEIVIGVSRNFAEASEILVEPPGLAGEIVPAPKPVGAVKNQGRKKPIGSVRARLTVATDAPLGPREIRVGTAQGASTVGLAVVVDAPVTAEADDRANNRPEGAQPISFPAAVSGKIGAAEDVDWYSFEGVAGRSVVFEVWANRLENKIHDLQTHLDPILSLYDDQGRELQTVDNYFYADPMLVYRLPKSGAYRLQIRDAAYGGGPFWTYALLATAGPAATSVFPAAVNPGREARLQAVGVNFDATREIVLNAPADLKPGVTLFDLPTAEGSTLPIPLVATEYAVAAESDDAAEEAPQAQAVELPAAIAGRLAKPGDRDAYTFHAKKGAVYSFEAFARRLYSECDPVVQVLDKSGKVLVERDDSPGFGKDLRFEWTAPADGVFAVRITDLHARGGDRSSYVILAEKAESDFEVSCDPDRINVGPGGRVPVFVKAVRRHGFKGPITLSWSDLPAGVSASPLTIPAGSTEGMIVVAAAVDAAAGARLVALQAAASGIPTRTVRPIEEIYMPGGGRGAAPVETLALSVTDPSDVSVSTPTKRLVLTPGQTVALDVDVQRRAPFAGPVNLDVVLQHLQRIHANPLPKGLVFQEAGSKTLLGPKESKGKIILKVDENAPACENHPIAVMGYVSINFVVKTAYCTESIPVTIKPKH